MSIIVVLAVVKVHVRLEADLLLSFNVLELAEVVRDDKDSGLDVLVFGADVNSDEACAQRSK